MKQLLLAIVITTLVSACATTTSPTGRRQMVGGVSQAQLDQLGAQAFAETKQKEKISSDGRQNGYVQCVVNALVAQLPAQYRGVRWETAVFVDKEPNAFALPGGKVGVNTGIFTVAKNQDQLAAVIGHEIGHVIARHHEERITRQMGAQTGLAVLGALAGAAYGDGAHGYHPEHGEGGRRYRRILEESEAIAHRAGRRAARINLPSQLLWVTGGRVKPVGHYKKIQIAVAVKIRKIRNSNSWCYIKFFIQKLKTMF